MSIISLLSASFSPYQALGSRPTAVTAVASTAKSSATVAREQDERPRSRENSLVNAMMTAFQALGFGPAAFGTTPTPGDTPAASVAAGTSVGSTAPSPAMTADQVANIVGTSTASAASTATGSASTAAAAATTATDPAVTSDTLEKAVREFAHALFGAMQGSARSEHGQQQGHDGRGDEHSSENGSRRSSGYNGFVQRLEALAQSLGAAAPKPAPAAGIAPGATATSAVTPPAATPSPVVAAVTTPPAATTSTTTAASPVTVPAPTPGTSHLLSAFTKLFNLLQPQTSGTTADASGANIADKLKLFLHALAQSMQAAPASAPPSATGSLLNVSV